MKDEEKFEGFKQKMIDENEEKYGKETRKKYGEDTINKSNAKLKNMTQEEYEEITNLANEIIKKLELAFKEGNPRSELAQEVANMHKRWLTFYWDTYSKEVHIGLANMYVQDERFKKYYDIEGPGRAEFLRDSIEVYTGMKE